MSSLKRHEGYLLVDHRFSPGLPEDIARQSGYDPKQCAEGAVMEMATLTCSHCKIVYVKNDFRTRERCYCQKCDHYICDFCGAASKQPEYSHLPFDKLVDITLNLAERGIVMGSPQELLNTPPVIAVP